METRSIILSALILALVVAGGVFYTFGRQFGVQPSQLGTGTDQTGDAQEEALAVAEGDTSIESDVDTDTNQEVAMADKSDPTVLSGTPVSDEGEMAEQGEVAGAQEVTPTAETGTGTNVILAGVMAIIIGFGGVILALRTRISN